MGILYGDLTADQRDIILMGAGTTDWENQEIADNLRGITPLLRASQPPGAILVPATWAAVTQVAATFALVPHIPWAPGPDLQQWMLAEVMRRMAVVAPLARPETDRVPMPHQQAGGHAIGVNRRFFLGDDMGPQPATTPVLTPSGWTELGALAPGDHVLGSDGSPVRVEAVTFLGRLPAYRVTLSDRTSTLATRQHRWRVWSARDRSRGTHPGGRVLSTGELASAPLLQPGTGSARWYLPQQPEVSGGTPASALPLDPYAYGALLGDGHLSEARITVACPDRDIARRVREQAAALGTTSHPEGAEGGQGRGPSLAFHRDGGLRAALRDLGALTGAAARAVHGSYLRGDGHVRRALLHGLLDAGGSVSGSAGAEFSSASPALARDVAFLGRSLGAVVTEASPQPASCRKDGTLVPCRGRHRVMLRFPADGPGPFWCERKAAAWARAAATGQRRRPPRAITAIEPEGDADACCITVAASDGVYLTGTALIPTHNCGKSGTALLGLDELRARGQDPFPALVVCPASVVDSWLEEVAAWYPSWTATAYMGPRRTRLSHGYHLYVTSYDTFRNDMQAPGHGAVPPLVRRLAPRTIIADEAHAITSADTGQSRAMRAGALMVPYFIPMSGTPIKKNVRGFWPALYCIDPAAFPSGTRFTARYAQGGQSAYGAPSEVAGLNPRTAAEFHQVMTGTMRYVHRADVLEDLPPKRHSVRVVAIPPAWRAAYDEMEQDMIAHLPDSDDAVLPVMSTLTQLMRLQQLACSACDVTITTEWDASRGEDREVIAVAMREPCWKVDELMAVLAGHDGSPVIACAPYRQLMELAGARAAAAGLRVGYIVGGQSRTARRAARHAFQRGETDLLCMTTSAGGVGLTLTAAHTMVVLARPWAYWQSEQQEARVHRKGQEHDVNVIDIVARDTIEARVRKAIQDKARNLGELVRSPRIVREVLGGLPANPRASSIAA